MRFMSWPQGVVLLIGLLIVMLSLIIPFSPFSIYYTHESASGDVTTYTVTCPAPVDQPSCDEYKGPVRVAICEACNGQAGTQMTWFWILFSLTTVGTVAAYFYMGRLLALRK